MTSKTDASKQEESTNSQAINQIKNVESKRVITGREIILQYLKGDAMALLTYRKICNALEVLPNWEPEAKIQFLEQFLNVGDIVDNRCADLVSNLARLSWQAVPDRVLDRYVKMLCDIAVRQVCHMEVIYSSAVNNLVPVVKESEDGGIVQSALAMEEQELLYNAAHRIIAQILKCLPMSSNVLLRLLRSGVPHISHDSHRFINYIRNLMRCLEYTGKVRSDIWDIIVDQMIVCDNMLSKAECHAEKKLTGDSMIFQMDEDQRDSSENENGESERLTKLDGAMRDVLCYIASRHMVEIEIGELNWLHMNDGQSPEELFNIFSSLLENRMLLAVHVRYTSFLWLYFCSINETYATRILNLLWSVIVRPHVAQVDMAKAQGAAAYIAAFLARAQYLGIEVAMQWMSRIVHWCLQYLDNCGVVPGVMRHGTFYALCQTFFIIFSFRYKEVVSIGGVNEVAHWGLARMLHSSLDPLKYVSGPVGQCFAAISRSLQLVYCNHVLPLDSEVHLPFEPMFPFDTYKLKSSMEVILPLLRRFSPLAEDRSEVISALRSSTIRPLQEESMDFLDDEDEIMNSVPTRTPVTTHCNQVSLFTVYSTSPGLRHFETPLNMRFI